MPLQKGSSKKKFVSNIKELIRDNQKKGKARGADGKPRTMKQILAIAYAQKRK